jgi:hypothetical protein
MNNAQRKLLAIAMDKLRTAQQAIADISGDIEAIRDEEQDKYDNMPESLQSGDKGERMNEGIEHLTSLLDAIESFDIESHLSDLESL